ncbi:nucleoside triphosphate pyrophosphohydrolase [Methylobacterium indicum]|uniref:Nucleoside triphosphate hydrolase n=1 Tax=Methylobacterium indicum TaxID=1775910 RepID=A0ABR5HI94_9HYPH|nr:nucleoside triphosphate pyrophosphohydrolase [Methylobacterium indicum]KMO15407.1 nucleoside triphosphate hydrolase [Methylobacterium indicum]KMO26282.1 nucleoside triphosphate hydrolase [Methylobacterium indicum]
MSTTPIARLLGIMARLRDPEGGCPWDLAQSHASIVPYTIEEAYEVAEAVETGDPEELRDELGDLLFQVVFQARIAEEAGTFGFDEVATAIADKMVRRHPHIFGDAKDLDPAAVNAQWATIKAEERRAKAARAAASGRPPAPEGILDGVPLALPALARAEKISRKAAAVGFDWPDAAEVVAKVREETDEVVQALAGEGPEAVAEEIGDLLFSVANLARHAGVDPEEALRRANLKFQRRFAAMEAEVTKDGRPLAGAGLATMEEAWVAVKRRERQNPPL